MEVPLIATLGTLFRPIGRRGPHIALAAPVAGRLCVVEVSIRGRLCSSRSAYGLPGPSRHRVCPCTTVVLWVAVGSIVGGGVLLPLPSLLPPGVWHDG